ncbi:MAG TPA: hypothetical protein VGF93_02800 [Solirubrobacteraceae bacterium]
MKTSTLATITIRSAYADDQASLSRLAALDSAAGVPGGALLLAEVDEQLRAALSLTDGSVIADPFFATVDLVALLRTRATAIAGPNAARLRRRARAHRPRRFVLTG